MAETDAFNKRIVKGYDENGNPDMDIKAANEIKYEKVAMALIEPKMTVGDLKKLPASALKAITEINILISGEQEELTDEEGN